MADLEKRNKYKSTSPNHQTVTFALATALTFHLDPCNAGENIQSSFSIHTRDQHTLLNLQNRLQRNNPILFTRYETPNITENILFKVDLW